MMILGKTKLFGGMGARYGRRAKERLTGNRESCCWTNVGNVAGSEGSPRYKLVRL